MAAGLGPDCITYRKQHEALKTCAVRGLFIHNTLKIHVIICTCQTGLEKGFQLGWSSHSETRFGRCCSGPRYPHGGGTSGQRGGQKFSRASSPGGVPTDTACKLPPGLPGVPSVHSSLNCVLGGEAASPLCKLRPPSEHVRT